MWFKNKKQKPSIPNKPTHWCLGWTGDIELGFDDGKYLPRKAALIIYPQFFTDGKPNIDMLPIDSLELSEQRRKKYKR